MQAIFIGPEITKKLEVLRRGNKKAALAAAQAEKIMDRIQFGNSDLRQAGTPTKYGEARIKGIVKFDLGSGYRLITFRQADRMYLLFTGTHDECHRWLENNRDLTEEQIKYRCTPLKTVAPDRERPAPSAERPEEEPDPLPQLAEKDLRSIFRGLIHQGGIA